MEIIGCAKHYNAPRVQRVNGTSILVNGLQPNRKYNGSVCALTSAGCGPEIGGVVITRSDGEANFSVQKFSPINRCGVTRAGRNLLLTCLGRGRAELYRTETSPLFAPSLSYVGQIPVQSTVKRVPGVCIGERNCSPASRRLYRLDVSRAQKAEES